jgi:hypothetical protein
LPCGSFNLLVVIMSDRRMREKYGDDADAIIDQRAEDYVQSKMDDPYYNTGKVVIGSLYTPPQPPMSADMETIQSALLDQPTITPEDIMAIMTKVMHLIAGVAAVGMVAGVLYALATKQPEKPVPDCGSCRIYKDKTK